MLRKAILAIAIILMALTPVPSTAAGLLVKLKSVTNLTLFCDEAFKKCQPTGVDPVDEDWPVRTYRLFSDGVYKYKDGKMYRCLAGKWVHFRISDSEYYSCSVSPTEGGVILLEKFGPREQDEYNTELQVSAFVFKSMSCTGATRLYEDSRWVERRRDTRCWRDD